VSIRPSCSRSASCRRAQLRNDWQLCDSFTSKLSRKPGASPRRPIRKEHCTFLQQGIFGSQGIHYFYPAVIPDSNNNAYLAFCRSGPSDFASLYFAGRAVTDPSGSLSGSVLLKPGTAPYVHKDPQGRNRWGDYLAVSPDPSGSSVWLNGGYAIGAIQWATHVAQVTI
jgi:hypothetical protein